MNRIKYFYQDHRNKINSAAIHAAAIGCVLLSTWLTIGVLIVAAYLDIRRSRG